MEELRFHEDTSIQEMLYSVYNIEPKGWVLLPVRKFTEVLPAFYNKGRDKIIHKKYMKIVVNSTTGKNGS